MKNFNFIKLTLLFTLVAFGSTLTITSLFTNTGFPALDIGVNSEGEVAVVGTDNNVYRHDFMDEDWIKIDTKGIRKITRIDMDGDGRIYIASECGIYYLDCENRWIRLPGSATDIGVGVDFTVWKIGTDEIKVKKSPNNSLKPYLNYGVWKLICDCKCLCICRRYCIRFRLRSINPCPPEGNDPPKCYWFRTEGYGINIDVYPNGDAAIAVKHNKFHTTVKTVNHQGMYFRDLQCGGKNYPLLANDITVGNTGVVYVTTTGGLIYKCDKDSHWVKIVLYQNKIYTSGACCKRDLKANRISAGPFNQMWFTHKVIKTKCKKLMSNMVYTSSRFDYINLIPKNWPNNTTPSALQNESTKA